MNIVDVLAKYIRPYYYIIIGIVVLIIFLIVTYYAYNKFYVKSNNQFSDVANADRSNKDASVLFFHADWCPHCKKAEPEWNTFKSQYDGKSVNGYVVNCVDINCTDEKDSSVTASINQYKIESYPTVKMLKDNQVIEFDSKITNTSLNSFVETMLNQ